MAKHPIDYLWELTSGRTKEQELLYNSKLTKKQLATDRPEKGIIKPG